MTIKKEKSAEAGSIKHPKAFAYKKGGHENRPPLQPNAYTARELMNCTVASFYNLGDEELTTRQIRARDEFMKLFERQAKRPTQQLHDRKKELYDTVRRLMGYLDEFFFFGSLTHGPRNLVQELVLAEIPDSSGVSGECSQLDSTEGWPQFMILLSNQRDDCAASLVDIVSTLVHELTHAFLAAFVCVCRECRRNDVNAVSLQGDGHGPTFRGLCYAAMVCMTDWRADFAVDTEVSHLSHIYRHWEKRIEADKERGILEDSNAVVRNHSQRLFIWTSENEIEIAGKRLRKHVLRTAASTSSKTYSKSSNEWTKTKKALDDEPVKTG